MTPAEAALAWDALRRRGNALEAGVVMAARRASRSLTCLFAARHRLVMRACSALLAPRGLPANWNPTASTTASAAATTSTFSRRENNSLTSDPGFYRQREVHALVTLFDVREGSAVSQ